MTWSQFWPRMKGNSVRSEKSPARMLLRPKPAILVHRHLLPALLQVLLAVFSRLQRNLVPIQAANRAYRLLGRRRLRLMQRQELLPSKRQPRRLRCQTLLMLLLKHLRRRNPLSACLSSPFHLSKARKHVSPTQVRTMLILPMVLHQHKLLAQRPDLAPLL